MLWPILEALARDLEAFGDFEGFQREVQDRFEGLRNRGAQPAVNVYGNDTEVVVKAELPGVEPNAIKLSVDEQVLTIEGERKPVELGEEDACLQQELPSGTFKRQVRLPFEVNYEAVVAKHQNGVLTVTLPRAEASRAHVIDVEAV